jgi:hypothetical protein
MQSHSKRPFNLTSQQLAKQQLADHNVYRCEVDAIKMASLEYHQGLTAGKGKKRSAGKKNKAKLLAAHASTVVSSSPAAAASFINGKPNVERLTKRIRKHAAESGILPGRLNVQEAARFQWCTHTVMVQMLDKSKTILLDKGYATEEKEVVTMRIGGKDTEVECPISFTEDQKRRIVAIDEKKISIESLADGCSAGRSSLLLLDRKRCTVEPTVEQ